MDKSRTKRPVSPDEASRLLGITVEAVRKRYQRKTLEGYKDKRGRLFVYVQDNVLECPDDVVDKQDGTQAVVDAYKSRDELYERTISIMQDTIDSLNRQLEAKDRELEWKDTIFLKTMKELKILQVPRPSLLRRFLGGQSDE